MPLLDISTEKILTVKKLVQEKILKQPPDKVTIFDLIMCDLDESLREYEVGE